MEIDAALGRNEPDYEIRQLLKASTGLNLALDYLPGSTMFDPAARDTAPADEASMLVWFDAYRAEHRPHAAQCQPAGVASQAVSHRPWRGAVLPSRLADEGEEDRVAVCADQGSYSAAVGDGDCEGCGDGAREADGAGVAGNCGDGSGCMARGDSGRCERGRQARGLHRVFYAEA